ncbi:peptide transporter [Lysobacter arseniciresistens ZS79]|uniref:Peptide transporter n=1 Tax=Lysobacter arseniciresistens ZS79 TaxID=913325 RepID=A0A0A0EXJ3_9GAMM|nr:ParA family protein [Lysobacter arseniciresistens]KGM54808.1 peptide transporter [Lysobacter arseniciresistens ZS79]
MRLCIYNAKGGSGRTTTCLNLAGFYAQSDARVLVCDRDPQGSALAWSALPGEKPFTVGCGRSRGFDIELIDMPPSLPANGLLPEADLYVVPTLLDGVSFVVFLRTMQLIEERGLPHVVVANRFNPKRAEHRARLENKHLHNAVIFPERAAFASYYAQGKTLFEMTGPYLKAARNDIERLACAIEQSTKPTGDQL